MHSKKDKSQLRKKKGEKTENITASSNRRGRGKPEKHRKTDLSNNFSRGERGISERRGFGISILRQA